LQNRLSFGQVAWGGRVDFTGADAYPWEEGGGHVLYASPEKGGIKVEVLRRERKGRDHHITRRGIPWSKGEECLNLNL